MITARLTYQSYIYLKRRHENILKWTNDKLKFKNSRKRNPNVIGLEGCPVLVVIP